MVSASEQQVRSHTEQPKGRMSRLEVESSITGTNLSAFTDSDYVTPLGLLLSFTGQPHCSLMINRIIYFSSLITDRFPLPSAC